MAGGILARIRRRRNLANRRVLRRPRVLRDRSNPFLGIDAQRCRAIYRFFPETIVFLLEVLEDLLRAPTRRSLPLPPYLQLAIYLRFTATNAFYTVLAEIYNVSPQSVMRSIRRVAAAICQAFPHTIRMPRDLRELKEVFFRIAGKKLFHCNTL